MKNMISSYEKFNWQIWEIHFAGVKKTIGIDEKYNWSPKSLRGGKIQKTSLKPRQWDSSTATPSIGNFQLNNHLKLKLFPVSFKMFIPPPSSHQNCSCAVDICHLSRRASKSQVASGHRSWSQKVKPRSFLQGGITAFPLPPRDTTTTTTTTRIRRTTTTTRIN